MNEPKPKITRYHYNQYPARLIEEVRWLMSQDQTLDRHDAFGTAIRSFIVRANMDMKVNWLRTFFGEHRFMGHENKTFGELVDALLYEASYDFMIEYYDSMAWTKGYRDGR